MRRLSGVTIAAAASVAILAGSSSEGRAAPEHAVAPAAPAASGTLTMAIATDPGNLDPHLTLLGAARTVGSFTYDTLVNVVGPGRLAGNLARTWRVRSPKRVEFTLRRGMTCSDGSAMTATVVKRNLDFVVNPANRSPYLGVGVPVGATTTANNRTGTVVVTTKTPNPFMIHGLGLVQMVCSRGLENRNLLDRGALGSGPYRLVESVSGDHYTFQVRNGYRWGPNGATTAALRLPARVILRVVSNESTAANLLLTRGINVATILGAERARLNGRGYFRRTTIAFPTELFFNQRQGKPGADAQVRRAIVQAVNLRQWGTVVTSGRGVPVTQLTRQDVTPCPGNTVSGTVPAYNPGAARSVLNGRGTRLRIIYPTDAGIATINSAMELMQQQLSAAGVSVTLAGMSTAALQGAIFGAGDWDMVVIGIGVTSPAQLVPFLSGPTPPNGTNFSAIDNLVYRASVARANRRVGRVGCRFWLEGERSLMRQADIVPTSALTAVIYGNGASFALSAAGVIPTSLRLTR